jgi:hypothetical protein
MRSSLSPEAARRLLFSPPPRNGPLHLYLRVGNDLVPTRPYALGPWSRPAAHAGHSVLPSGTGRRFRLRISPKTVELLLAQLQLLS